MPYNSGVIAHLAQLHGRLQITISLVLAGLLIWGLFCAARGSVGRGYLAGLAIAQLLLLTQALIGLPVLLGAARPGALILHIIYGGVAVSCLPAVYLYNRGRAGRWEALTFAAVALFLLGVAIRAAQTSGG